MAFMFLVLILFVLSVSFYLIFPLWKHLYEVYITVTLFAICTLFYVVSMIHDPGCVESHPNVDFLVSELLIY